MSLQTAPESLFWYWISERHAIYLRRKAGQPKPWTDDPILRDYKFTNPFRENDRGTVWLRENFLEPHRDVPSIGNDAGEQQYLMHAEWHNLELLAFNICWYRMFNWWGTGEYVGWITNFDDEAASVIREQLKVHASKGNQIFTGAHIIYSRPGKSKIDAIIEVCTDFWERRNYIAQTSRQRKSLEVTYWYLRQVDSVGGFMAYEMVCDMYHTRLLEDATDINTWANLGPGAKRGLERLGLPNSPEHVALNSMRGLLLDSEFSSYPAAHRKYSDTPRLRADVPALELRDIEHSLCEFDKYCRVKFGEGRPRSMYPGRA